ncbi:MAG: metallophosphoesterase [Alistipes sp.]|nr:metallophosphoesterase [Alistipes sp.]
MNRKDFLGAVLALGGVALSPAKASVLESFGDLAEAGAAKKLDPSLVVFLSDIHICGEIEDGKPKHYPYNPTSLSLRIKEILAMRSLPANVVVTGDVAWDYGMEEDYHYAAELLQPLVEAGIRVTLGLGNHDRRAAFFKVFPQYKESSPIAGRAVSVVELPDADLIVLDTLSELPDLKPRQGTTVSGAIDKEQLTWLQGFLAKAARPVLLCAHHPIGDMPGLVKLVTDSPAVAGYIYGHVHIWNKSVSILRQRVPQRMLSTVALPATFYGDIGCATMRVDKNGAKIGYSSKGFWWPQPSENPPQEWEQRQKDLADEKCTICF